MVYITGDTHGVMQGQLKWAAENLQAGDYLIVCGDFGFIWATGKEPYPEAMRYSVNGIKDLNTMEKLPFTILFVDGNHENFNLLNSYPVKEWNGGWVHEIRENIFHLMRGQVFNIDDKTFYTFGGASSIDKMHRVPNITWWEAEIPTLDEYNVGVNNLAKVGNKVDYIITHCVPTSYLHRIDEHFYGDKATDMLEGLSSFVKYKRWYAGHYHEDMDIGRISILYHAVVPLGKKEKDRVY